MKKKELKQKIEELEAEIEEAKAELFLAEGFRFCGETHLDENTTVSMLVKFENA